MTKAPRLLGVDRLIEQGVLPPDIKQAPPTPEDAEKSVALEDVSKDELILMVQTLQTQLADLSGAEAKILALETELMNTKMELEAGRRTFNEFKSAIKHAFDRGELPLPDDLNKEWPRPGDEDDNFIPWPTLPKE